MTKATRKDSVSLTVYCVVINPTAVFDRLLRTKLCRWFNPLSPDSDEHEIFYIITTCSNIHVENEVIR